MSILFLIFEHIWLSVEKYIETINTKLGVETRTAALLKAVKQLKH